MINNLVLIVLSFQTLFGLMSVLARKKSTSKISFAGGLISFCVVSTLLQSKFTTYSDLTLREHLELAALLISVFSLVTPFLRWIRHRSEISFTYGTDIVFRLVLFGIGYSFVTVGGLSPVVTVPIMSAVAFGLFARKELMEGLQ